MIGKARRGADSNQTLGALAQEEKQSSDVLVEVQKLCGFRLKRRHISLLVALVAFIVLLAVQPLDEIPTNHCLAILVFATILWATEVSWRL